MVRIPQMPAEAETQPEARRVRRVRLLRVPGTGWTGRLAALAAVIVALAILLLVLSLVNVLPKLRNPFVTTTTVSNGPVLLKSMTALSRYEAASGSFQVVVDLTKKTSFLPSFLAGSQTLFVGYGTDIAYVDFSQLKGPAIQAAPDRSSVTVTLPKPQLEPAVLNPRKSYVFAQQQGLLDRIGSFFGGNPNSQQAVYIDAQHQIGVAARQSTLLANAQTNTKAMLTGMLSALGYRHVTIQFAVPTHS